MNIRQAKSRVAFGCLRIGLRARTFQVAHHDGCSTLIKVIYSGSDWSERIDHELSRSGDDRKGPLEIKLLDALACL
jgi:hypothetical protein